MNTTPRTDAAVSNGYRFTQDGGVREYVPADFARQLETELAAANALLREAKIMLIRTAYYVPASATSKKDFTDGKPIEECRTKDRAHATIDRIAAHLEENK